jgi:hypothetical protein
MTQKKEKNHYRTTLSHTQKKESNQHKYGQPPLEDNNHKPPVTAASDDGRKPPTRQAVRTAAISGEGLGDDSNGEDSEDREDDT